MIMMMMWLMTKCCLVNCCITPVSAVARHLYARTTVLKMFCCHTGSQWRSRTIGLVCSDILAPVTRWAASFWTTCSLCSSWSLTPASKLLQQSSWLLTEAWTSVLFASGISDWSFWAVAGGRNRICWVPQSDSPWWAHCRAGHQGCCQQVKTEPRRSPIIFHL